MAPPDTGSTPAPTPPQRARRAIVVVDMVESVRLMQEHEDDVIDRWRRFVHEVRTELLPAHGGRMVKSLGDGMLLEFADALPACAAAFQVQRCMASYNLGHAPGASLFLRLGGHVGKVVVAGDDIYGHAVNLASRLAGVAAAGEIVVSPEFRERLVPGLDAEVHDLGEVYVKHLDTPLHAFRLEPASSVPLMNTPTLPPDTHALLPTLAVMPLTDGQAAGLEGELLADSIAARLSRCGAVKVVSRLSTSALAGRGLAPAEVGRLLQCNYLLQGHCGRVAGQLAVYVELVDTQGQHALWAERRTLQLAELLQPDDPHSAEIANQVSQALLDAALQRSRAVPLPSLQSYSLNLAAVNLMHRSPTTDFQRAHDLLAHLVERHPRIAQPRALLAQWHVLRVTRGLTDRPAEEGRRALDQTRQAMDSQPDCSLALAMEGFVHCHIGKDLALAGRSLDQALDINPNEPLAWLFKCVVQGFLDQGPQAWASAQRALALSPLDPMRHYFQGLAASAAVAANLFSDAAALAERSLRVNRNHLPTLRALAVACVHTGELARARTAAARLLALDPGFSLARYLAAPALGAEGTRLRYAQALREAGIPNH